MTYPPPIEKGMTAALIQPAGAIRSPEGYHNAVQYFESLGFNVKSREREKYGYLAGTDTARAAELNNAFADTSVDAVICMKGGYGTSRILDLIDYDIIRANPKMFLGYSDITTLHTAINEKCELATLHGPMPAADFPLNDFSLDSLGRALNGDYSLDTHCNCVNPGSAYGRLCGGNLTLIATSLGTPYEIDTSGKLLFIEEIGERTYRIDNMLSQIRLAGKLDDCAGVVLGDFIDCPVEYPDFGLTLEDIVSDMLAPLNKPVLTGLPAGHGIDKLTLLLGGVYGIENGRFYYIGRI